MHSAIGGIPASTVIEGSLIFFEWLLLKMGGLQRPVVASWINSVMGTWWCIDQYTQPIIRAVKALSYAFCVSAIRRAYSGIISEYVLFTGKLETSLDQYRLHQSVGIRPGRGFCHRAA